MRRPIPAAFVVLAMTSGVAGQSPPRQAMPEAGPASPLAGPAVAERSTPTLVRHDYAGRVRRLETTPEEAALELLDLDAAALEAARGVLASRAALLDRLVRENLDLLIQLHTAGQSGDTRRLVVLGLELYQRAEPLRQRGPLRGELRAALPPARRAEFDRLIDEYWRAIHAEAPRGERFGRVVEERFRLMGEQVARSFERQQRSGEITVEYVLSRLGLPAEQERRVRALIADQLAGQDFEAMSEQERGVLFLSVMAHLNEEQRGALVRIVRGG